jgi:hypothetical protein
MNNADVCYFRCILATHEFDLGDVYPAWKDSRGALRIAYNKDSWLTLEDGHRAWLRQHFEPATAADFDASVKLAMDAVDEIRSEHAQFRAELSGVSTALLGMGEAPAASGETTTALAIGTPAGQLRNRAHGLKRRADTLANTVKERKGALEVKLGQKLAIAMASLDDIQKLVGKLEEVVFTVQLYLGRDEEVVCLREGEPAPADTPLCVRQNVLYMDEEIALSHDYGIDCTEIDKFDEWLLASPEHLQQVMPEPKGVVVLEVRRNDKKYQGDGLADILESVAKNEANHMSYWLIRNGERLHRIHANIFVGKNLIPRDDELDHFFYVREYGAKAADEPTRLRPGSRAYLRAMEEAGAVRRHFMRLALVLQGLIDRTQLFAPYKGDVRPNLLDPDSTQGSVHFLRDVDGTITDGRPSFRDWLAGINEGMEHGHRIVGKFDTYFRDPDDSPIHPRHATGVNDEPVHTVIESNGRFHFAFTRTDTVYRRVPYSRREESGDAKTKGTYKFSRNDGCFICIDAGATIEEMEYYLKDRRHRREYESMVPCLKAAITFKKEETAAEAPFRELLQRMLTEAVPGRECTSEQVNQMIHWWKTKVKIHRALLSDDQKSYRMIRSRYVAIAAKPASANDERMILEAAQAQPTTVLAFYRGDKEFGMLHKIESVPHFLREETWKVVAGQAKLVATEPFVLAQKADYAIFRLLLSRPAWAERPASFIPTQHLSPAHYPALVEFAKRIELDKEDGELLAAVYLIPGRRRTVIRVATFELTPSNGWQGRRPFPKDLLSLATEPKGSERSVSWSGRSEPTFRTHYAGSTGTFIGHDDEFQLGWQKEDAIVLFEDKKVLEDVAKFYDRVKKHNRRVGKVEDWIGEACETAEAALEKVWHDRQLAKYVREGGAMEFFEDHLKTLKKEIPRFDFLRSLLKWAIRRGSSPKQIASLPLEQLVASLEAARPRATDDDNEDDDGQPEVDADLVKQLVAAGWQTPEFAPGRGPSA